MTAARARREAADAETGLAYAGLLGPTTLLFELDLHRRRTSEARAGGPDRTATAREITWVSSLFLPLRLKALAEGGEAGARADRRGAEGAARARALRASLQEMRLRLGGAAAALGAAEQARRDAGLAFAEMDRRYRGAVGGADASSHAQAQDDLFAADAKAHAARGALTALLAALQRHLP